MCSCSSYLLDSTRDAPALFVCQSLCDLLLAHELKSTVIQDWPRFLPLSDGSTSFITARSVCIPSRRRLVHARHPTANDLPHTDKAHGVRYLSGTSSLLSFSASPRSCRMSQIPATRFCDRKLYTLGSAAGQLTHCYRSHLSFLLMLRTFACLATYRNHSGEAVGHVRHTSVSSTPPETVRPPQPTLHRPPNLLQGRDGADKETASLSQSPDCPLRRFGV